jgi:glycosyltransferase involved in cell wall biosynthesis
MKSVAALLGRRPIRSAAGREDCSIMRAESMAQTDMHHGSPSQPLVSIAMPVHNTEKTLALAIRSVLLQTYHCWELIIIDDASTDSSLAVAKRFGDGRIRLISEPTNLGLAARLNQAMDMSRGDLFARLDGDDLAYPERLERQVAFLHRHPEVDLLGTGAMVFAGDGKALGLYPMRQTHQAICRHPWSGFYLAHPTWMGRMAWFKRYRYRPGMAKSQDQDLLLRTYRSSTFACLPEELTGYRLERLSLRKTLISRYHLCQAFGREARRNRYYLAWFTAVAAQVAKGLYDSLTLVTGLDHLALKHRALRADPRALSRWEECWRRCNAT